MSRQQWGHGFYKGKEHGEHWGAVYAHGEWEAKLSQTAAKLHLLANSLRLPVEHKGGRTETWWKVYVSAAANELEAIARSIPGTLNGVYEFEKDIPPERGPHEATGSAPAVDR